MTLPLTLDDTNASTIGSEPSATTSAWAGPCCEKCSAPLQSGVVTVCRQCGWYASLGQFVEIDKEWEVHGQPDERPAARPQPSHIGVWHDLLPWWAWLLIATAAAVVVESIAVRLLTTAGSALRTNWSLAQLAIGLLLVVVCHIINFLVAVVDDAEIGALDMLLKPAKLWIRAAKNLPQRLWVSDAALAGLTAVVMSLVVIGGLPYERLWDWGFEKPPEQNLMGAVMSRMQQIEGEGGADNLEDAVGDFAGSQDLDSFTPPQPPPKPRQKVDCVILGYRLDAQGRLTSIILAAAHRRKLAYAGYVTPKLSGEELDELAQRLAAEKTDRPILNVQTTAVWVKPKFSCRVSYTKRSETGRLLDAQWEELLGEMRLE